MPRVPWTLVDLDGTWLMELIGGSNLSPGAHRDGT